VPRSGPAGLAAPAKDQIHDPLEPLNRGILAFNDIIDFALLKPAATVLSYAPDFVKESIRNVLSNLRSPVTFANDVMQFTFRDAARTFDRFVINSTLGVGGLWDPAEKLFGIRGHRADFGQTLYSHGATAGFYLVLPLIGPSNLRDGVGLAVDSLIDPWGYFLPTEFTLSRIGLTAVSTREELLDPLDELRKSSIDWYAGLRGAYYQARARELLKHPERAAASERQAVDDLFDAAE
ncbi:MAG: VacJ family lipoprotein, partial [Alphaproteobacteria bacterium]|nr:VacJ family lipoprotein [Alphaproteobacteria bacterium]